ncbi:unnamed protein product [Malus baccata var. baccata]
METPQPRPPVVPRYLQEIEFDQEDKDLISSLPTEEGWGADHIHKQHLAQGSFVCHSEKSALSGPSATPFAHRNPHALVPFMEFDVYNEKQVLPDLSSEASPKLFSTHLPYVSLPDSVKHSGCKVVYLCRDPKAVLVSLWHFGNKLRPVGYWKESLKRPESVIFIKFEEMKEEPALHLRRLAEFLGCPFSPEEETHGVVDGILRLCSFDNLSNLVVNKSGKLPSGIDTSVFFRKGEVGDWMNYLTTEMVKKVDSITQEKLLLTESKNTMNTMNR